MAEPPMASEHAATHRFAFDWRGVFGVRAGSCILRRSLGASVVVHIGVIGWVLASATEDAPTLMSEPVAMTHARIIFLPPAGAGEGPSGEGSPATGADAVGGAAAAAAAADAPADAVTTTVAPPASEVRPPARARRSKPPRPPGRPHRPRRRDAPPPAASEVSVEPPTTPADAQPAPRDVKPPETAAGRPEQDAGPSTGVTPPGGAAAGPPLSAGAGSASGSGGSGLGGGGGAAGAGAGEGDGRGAGEGSGADGDRVQAWLGVVRARIDDAKRYPMLARRLRLEGTVIVLLRIDATGALLEASARDGAHEALREAAVDAVRQAAPFPRPPAPERTVSVEVPLVFSLTDPPARREMR